MYRNLVIDIVKLLERIEVYEPLIKEGLLTEAEAKEAAELSASLENIDKQADQLLGAFTEYSKLLSQMRTGYDTIGSEAFAGKFETISPALDKLISTFSSAQTSVKGFAQQDFGGIMKDDAIGSGQSAAGAAWRGINSFFGGDSKKKESLERLASVAVEFSQIHAMIQATVRGIARAVKYAEKEQPLDDKTIPIIDQIDAAMLKKLEKSLNSETKGKGSGFFASLVKKVNIFSQDIDPLLGLKNTDIFYAFLGLTPGSLIKTGQVVMAMGSDVKNIANSMKDFGKKQAKAELAAKNAAKQANKVYQKFKLPIDAADAITPKDDLEAIKMAFSGPKIDKTYNKELSKLGESLENICDPLLSEAVHMSSMEDMIFEHDDFLDEGLEEIEELIMEYCIINGGLLLEQEDIEEITRLLIERRPRGRKPRKRKKPKKSKGGKKSKKGGKPPKKGSGGKNDKKGGKNDKKKDDKKGDPAGKAGKPEYQKQKRKLKAKVNKEVGKVDKEKTSAKKAKNAIESQETKALKKKAVKKNRDRKKNIKKMADDGLAAVKREDKENETGEEVDNPEIESPEDTGSDAGDDSGGGGGVSGEEGDTAEGGSTDEELATSENPDLAEKFPETIDALANTFVDGDITDDANQAEEMATAAMTHISAEDIKKAGGMKRDTSWLGESIFERWASKEFLED